MIKVLLDSSVIISGVHSKTGASHVLLTLARKGKIAAYVSPMILKEVIRNLKEKSPKEALEEFLEYVSTNNLRKVKLSKQEVEQAQSVVEGKDAHVVAAVFKANVNFLVSLDKKLLLSLKKKKFSFSALTPGEFVKTVVLKVRLTRCLFPRPGL